MSMAWPTAPGSAVAKHEVPPVPHACINGLAIATCPDCAGHPQGYRNPICKKCKGSGLEYKTCIPCYDNAMRSSTNTSQATTPATSCVDDCSTFDERMFGQEQKKSNNDGA